MLELRLECIGPRMTVVAIGEQKISEAWERLTCDISWRGEAIAVVNRIAGCNPITDGGAERSIVRRDFIEINSCDQSTLISPEIGEPNGSVAGNLALECDVVLLHARLLQTDRNGVNRRHCREVCRNVSARQRAESVRKARPRCQRIVDGVHSFFRQALVKGIGCDWIANSLGGGSWIVKAVPTADYGLIRQTKRGTHTWSEIVAIGADQSASEVKP